MYILPTVLQMFPMLLLERICFYRRHFIYFIFVIMYFILKTSMVYKEVVLLEDVIYWSVLES